MKCNMDPGTEKGISMGKLEKLHRVCSLVNSIDLVNVPWFCKMLTLGEAGSRAYKDSLHCLHNSSINIKLFQNKKIFK